MPSRFVHLHTHTNYSLLDGLSKVSDIIQKCIEYEMPAVAITDHGNLYSAIEFYKLAKEKGIKPIIGCELYIAANAYTAKQPKIDSKRYHLTILAQNYQGYQNLVKLVSHAWLEGFYYKPRVDFELLERYHEGLICLSGCMNSNVSRLILANKPQESEVMIQRLLKIFGKENFYLEVQPHPNLPEQTIVNKALEGFSKKFNIPLVLTYDSHYIEPRHQTAQDILIAIQTAEDNPQDRLSMKSEDFSFPNEEKILHLARSLHIPEEAVFNTLKVAESVDIKIPMDKKIMPIFPVPSGESDVSYLKKLVDVGIRKRYGFDSLPLVTQEEINKRVGYELKVVQETGYSSYFLIVQDFIGHARSKGIVVGPGRGSAAGSIVSYALRITDVEPLRYGLMFERFLNPERISFPDIDIDFADRRRDEVISYAREKYGRDSVAQIITFGKIKARQAIRDVGRILKVPYITCNTISKTIPPTFALKQASIEVPELRKLYSSDPQVKRLVDIAVDLEGVARHVSTHACGVVMADRQLNNYIPLQYASTDSKNSDSIISQYDMKAVEEIGLLKMDFLGLRNLTIIEDCMNLLKKYKTIEVNIESDTFDDPETFSLLKKGHTVGVFQLESDGMRRYLSELKPTDIEDVIAMISLYRPGPLDAGQVEHYIRRKHGEERIEYLHKSLEPILKKTYGIAVYQEQLIEIARNLAGFSYSEADKLRKAVGKKIKELLESEGDKLVRGMVKRGMKELTARRIWEWFIPFARYGFNRSHAASYAVLAYRTAFLKAHFPLFYLCALLINEGYKIERVAELLEEAQKQGIKILPPEINESDEFFTPIEEEGGAKIRFGLGVVKNVGEKLVQSLVEERSSGGKFTSLLDILTRVKHKDLNKKSLEALIKCGALDAFESRETMLFNIETLLRIHKESETPKSQDSLFGDEPVTMKLEPVAESPGAHAERLRWEKEFLGVYLTGHPLDQFKERLKEGYTIKKLRESQLKNAKVVGVIIAVRKVLTRTNKRMAFCKIEDLTGVAECIIFPTTYEQVENMLREENIVAIKGKVEKVEDDIKMIASTVEEVR